MKTQTIKCPKCDGTGFIQAYAGIANGICFRCEGNGVVKFKITKQNKLSPINAMHCETVEEANAFRVSEFCKRFPDVVLTEEAKNVLKMAGNVKATLQTLGM